MRRARRCVSYDAFDRMVEQARGTAHTQIAYSPTGMKLALMNGQTMARADVPLLAGAEAVWVSGSLNHYRHPDWLGSARVGSDPSRGWTYDINYAAYGEEYDGTTTNNSFTGQKQDTVTGQTGLYDFLYREYRHAHGRWISPDPAGMGAVNAGDPQSWNRYAYVTNRPLNTVDAKGLDDCGDFGCDGGGDCFWCEWGNGGWGGWFPGMPVGVVLPGQLPTQSPCNVIVCADSGGIDSLVDPQVGQPGPTATCDENGNCTAEPIVIDVTDTDPNNGQPQQPKKSGCGLAVTQGALSVGLDVLGAIPGLGNMVSAGAAGARVVNGIVAYGGAAYGIGTGLPDESPVGAVSAGTGLGLTLADAALEGGKVIPVLGNFLSVATGLYDGYQLAKTIQRCW